MMYFVTDFLTGMVFQSAPAWRMILAWSRAAAGLLLIAVAG